MYLDIQDILVYTGTYQVDKVNGLHIVLFPI
jgi:hypothetical protein